MVEISRRPLIEEIDIKLSPPDAFEIFRDRPFSFFLDSGMDPHKLGRYPGRLRILDRGAAAQDSAAARPFGADRLVEPSGASPPSWHSVRDT